MLVNNFLIVMKKQNNTTTKPLNQNKMNNIKYLFLVLPILTFCKYNDGRKEITFGWLTKTWTLKF